MEFIEPEAKKRRRENIAFIPTFNELLQLKCCQEQGPTSSKEKNLSYMESLPTIILQRIVDYLNPVDVASLMICSKTMNRNLNNTSKMLPTPCLNEKILYPLLDPLTMTLNVGDLSACAGGFVNVCSMEMKVTRLPIQQVRKSPFILENLLIPIGYPIDFLRLDQLEIAKFLATYSPKNYQGVAKNVGIILNVRPSTCWKEVLFLIGIVKPPLLVIEAHPENGSKHMSVEDLKRMFSELARNPPQQIEFKNWLANTKSTDEKKERLDLCSHTPFISGVEIMELEFRSIIRLWQITHTRIQRHCYKIYNQRKALKMEQMIAALANISTPFIGPIVLNLQKNEEHLRELPHQRYVAENPSGILQIDIFFQATPTEDNFDFRLFVLSPSWQALSPYPSNGFTINAPRLNYLDLETTTSKAVKNRNQASLREAQWLYIITHLTAQSLREPRRVNHSHFYAILEYIPS